MAGQGGQALPGGQLNLTDFAGLPPYARIALAEAVQGSPEWPKLQPDVACFLLTAACLSYSDELRYDEAIATGQRALRVAIEQADGDPALSGPALLHLGVAHARSGDIATSLPLYLEAASHARECGDEETLRNASTNILKCLESEEPTGDTELSFLSECMPRLEAAGLLSEAIRARMLIGAALIARRRPAEAIAALDRVLELTQSLGSARDIRHKAVHLLQDADTMLATGQEASPPLGPGTRGAVRALVEDGVDSIEHRCNERAVTCFERAAAQLARRSTEAERALAAFLFLLLNRLTDPGYTEDGLWPAGSDQKVSFGWFQKALKELRLIDVELGYWIKAREHAGDLDDLRMLAYTVAQEPSQAPRRRRRWGRGR